MLCWIVGWTNAAFTCYWKFPTYKVVITRLSYSMSEYFTECNVSALMSERIRCSIPLVGNHINIHRAIHAVRWQFWNFGKTHAYFTAYKTYNMLDMNNRSHQAYKTLLLLWEQHWKQQWLSPPPFLKFINPPPPNSETRVSTLFRISQ